MLSELPGDARFFDRSGPYSLAEVAAAARGTTDASERVLAGVAPLNSAGPGDVSFLTAPRFRDDLAATHAGAVLVHPSMVGHVPAGSAAIVVAATYEAWARVGALFHPEAAPPPGIDATARIAASARIDATASIGPFTRVAENAEIGAGCRIDAHVSIGRGVRVGPDSRIGSHVSVSHAIIGARVYLYPGVRIGQEGFSFARTRDGFLSVPQLGRVLIGDDVEIGANSTVDRGSVQDTVIGAGTRLDNLVQIAHNVRIGRHCVIVAQVGIAGSTVLEDYVEVGGQAAINGHVTIARRTRIGAQAGVISDTEEGAILLGSPAQPRGDFFRQVATLKRLARRRGADPAQ